jgi:hypothetical protein
MDSAELKVCASFKTSTTAHEIIPQNNRTSQAV